MLLQGFAPVAALKEFVQNIGIVHFKFPTTGVIPVKAFTPRAGESIEFFLHDPERIQYAGESIITRPAAIICGQQTKLIHRYVGHDFLFVGIGFQPGALFRLTGIPSHRLVDACIDAATVFPMEIRSALEQFRNADSYRSMVNVAEKFVYRLIQGLKHDTHGIDMAAGLLLKSERAVSMDWLAKETCLSARQFDRKFIERMGIAPSVLSRINRFDRAFKMKNTFAQRDWLSIAVQSGYHDYQHLVRDYKDFTGMTPTAFYDLDSNAPERSFGLKEEQTVFSPNMSDSYQ